MSVQTDMPQRAPDNACQATATVLEAGADFIEVKVERKLCAGCNGRCLGFGGNNPTIQLSKTLIDQGLEVTPGDVFSLSLPRTMLISLSLLVYLLPVALMLLFAIACDILFAGTEIAIAGASAVGLVAGFTVCRLAANRLSKATRAHISVTSIS